MLIWSLLCVDAVGLRRSSVTSHLTPPSVKLAGYQRARAAFATVNATMPSVPEASLHPARVSIPLTARIPAPLPSRQAMRGDAPHSLVLPSATRRAQHDHLPYLQLYPGCHLR